MSNADRMGRRFIYSLVRCVPDPRTGEFVNVAAIAGDPATGEWSTRQVSNERRARKLAERSQLDAVHSFLGRLGEQIDRQTDLLDAGAEIELDEEWLTRLHDDQRNVVQLSRPTPILSASIEGALDVVFARMIIDPVTEERGFITKSRLTSELQAAYRARLARRWVMPRPEVYVGDRLHAALDFAVANGRAVQLAQAWSFQRAGVAETAEQVKAWGYTLNQLREGHEARVVGASNRVATIDGASVDIQVVVAPPRTADQSRAYEEAVEIFKNVRATVSTLDHVDQVGQKAYELLDIDGA